MLVATNSGIYNIYFPAIIANAETGENNIDEVTESINRQLREIYDHENPTGSNSIVGVDLYM